MRRLIFAAFLCFAIRAQSEDVPVLTIPRVHRAPKFTDFLNNIPREAELVVTDFRQFDPGDGDPVSQPTTAYLSYDDKNLYVGWICKDDPSKIRARVEKRKAIMSDDRVTINIDAFHDHRHTYFFDVNPYGIQLDGTTTEGVGDDFSFETLWYSEAKITADGYVVLEAIPFKSLRFPSTPIQHWSIVLARFIQRNNELACWPYLTRRKLPAFIAQFGHLDGLENISAGRNFQVIPYALGSGSRFLDQPETGVPGYKTQADARAGVDAKAVIKDALTLDMTFNPDFSQVESDEPQVTVNQRYEVLYPEKRPFFMENTGFFATPEKLFFSRRIVDPQFGIRLTGKLGHWGIGVLSADDRAPAERTFANVLSLQRDFLTDSHLRLLVTDREEGSNYNRVGSLDLRLRLPKWFYLTAQGVRSDSNSVSGSAYRAGLDHYGRNFVSSTKYTDRSPQFRADLGFIPRVDIREARQRVEYHWRPRKGPIVSYGPAIEVMRNWNRTRLVQDWSVAPSFIVELFRLTQITVGRWETFELYQQLGFRKHANTFSLRTEWFRWMAMGADYASGRAVNYYPASGLLPFLADSTNSNVFVTVHPTPRLHIDETYMYSRLASPAATIFNDHIFRSKANYQFTRELSLRAIIDYNGVLPNTDLVSLTRTKRIGYDFLFTWMLHPGTALYAGYTDIYQNMKLDPSRPPYLQLTSLPDTSTGRQAFVKLSYLFRF